MTVERIDRLELNGGALRVLSAGEGPDLVYLHGVGDTGAFLPVLAELAARYRVTRPDHPGFIESDDLGIRSVADIAAVHDRMLDALGIDRVTLIGCSLGGWVATELAILRPERVERLVLIDAAGLAGDGTAPDVFTLDPESALEASVFDEERRAAARAATPDPVIAERLAHSRSTARLVASDPYMHDPTLAERAGVLTAAQIPVHIVWGQNDGILPVSYLESWRAAFPQAATTVIQRAGHLPHVEHADEFLAATGLLAEPSEPSGSSTSGEVR